MIYAYDPILVFVSIVVAIVGAYTCFDLVIKIRKSNQNIDRSLLVVAAFTIGGSIWSMHFVAMQALNLPIVIRYDLLVTLVSGLTCILMTAIALLIVTTNLFSVGRLVLGGSIMGLGIAVMHYIGMSAMRGNCTIEYEQRWIVFSAVIGILASTASLWAALRLRGLARRVIAALIMGLSISGVHYVGMIGTSFLAIEVALEVSQPILSPFGLGLITAVTTFAILGGTILSFMPNSPGVEAIRLEYVDTADESVEEAPLEAAPPASVSNEDADLKKLPVQENQRTLMIAYDDIVSITADGHYTSVFSIDGKPHFCNYSISRVEEILTQANFFRVHRSHIANLNHVEAFQRKGDKGVIFMLTGQHSIPVSRLKIAELQRTLKI